MPKSTLKWISFVALAITLLSLSPQIRFWIFRGAQWQGAYATVDGDEFLYSAYINALIDGRPRRNDPFSGRNDNPKAPLPESTFSIQWVPPLVISSLARFFGASASTAFIFLIGAAGFLASLAIFFLLVSITGDNALSAVGTLIVICFGTAAAGQGLLGLLFTGDASVGLLFLRRYQPAAAFFLFFVFSALTCHAFLAKNALRVRLYAAVAGVCFGLLVFSYLYLWTAAVAWLVCVFILWTVLKRDDLRKAINVVGVIAAISLLAFPFYIYLLSNRAANLTEVQTLISTRRPDLMRVPELIGALILVLLIFTVHNKGIMWRDARIILILSFAILPFVLFNQQILTGKSIQAFHYEDFIANYVVLVGLALLLSLWSGSLRPRIWLWLSTLCLLWGVIEVDLPAQARYTTDLMNDEMVPVLRRLKEFAAEDGTLFKLDRDGKAGVSVFSPHSEVMRLLPTWTPYGTLLGLGALDFGSASRDERRVYPYLYYCGVNRERFEQLLNAKSEDGFMNYYTRSAVFGHERVLPKLTYDFEPIRPSEIEEEVRFYEEYVAAFSRGELLRYPIRYVIVGSEITFNFSRIDNWYERTFVERVGGYDLFELKVK